MAERVPLLSSIAQPQVMGHELVRPRQRRFTQRWSYGISGQKSDVKKGGRKMSLEEMVKKFVGLATKSSITKPEQDEARQLMRDLKEAGMSNEEISKLSNGKWTQSTVKFYTPGIKPAQPSLWQNAVALLDSLISTNMTLEDVDTAVTVFEDLGSKGINLEQVIDLLLVAESTSVGLGTMVEQYKALKEFKISPEDIAKLLALKKELEIKELSLESLPALVKLASNYGDVQKVLEAITAYASIEEVQAKINLATNELESLSTQAGFANQKFQETQVKLSELSKPLDAYHKAVELGFEEKELVSLSLLAGKLGGPKAVLQALKEYINLTEIKNRVSKAKSELSALEQAITKLNTKHSHLATAINMCQTLINQYKFGLDAIATTMSLAEKYGDPLTILKTLEAYGKLQAIQQKLVTLEGKIAERQELLAQLEGKHKEALEQVESLNAAALKVGAMVSKVEYQLENSKDLQKLINLINNPASVDYDGYGPLVLVVAASLRKWVVNYEHKFKLTYSIKSGLESLISELGGK
ncbi:hypothetical protein ACFLVE_01225 [Chloroflexota bacterium]